MTKYQFEGSTACCLLASAYSTPFATKKVVMHAKGIN